MAHQIQMSAQPQMAQILTANGQLQQVQISSHQLTQQAPTNANQATVVNTAEAGSPAANAAQQAQVQQAAPQQLQSQQITLSGANGQQITVIPASSLANLQAAQQIRQQSNIIQVGNLVFIGDFYTDLSKLSIGSWPRQHSGDSDPEHSWPRQRTNHTGWFPPKPAEPAGSAEHSDCDADDDQHGPAASHNPDTSSRHANHL
jgi:hypothetical protein